MRINKLADGEYAPEWLEYSNTNGDLKNPEDLLEYAKAFKQRFIDAAQVLPPTDPCITVKDEQIDSDVKVRVYHPARADPSQRSYLPCLVFVHGGGWIAGDLDTEDHTCRTVCGDMGAVVVSVGYRLFPDAKISTSIRDVGAAFDWAYEHAESLGADVESYILWGSSAGCALSLATAYRLGKAGQGHKMAGLITMGPLCLHPQAVPEQYKDLYTSHTANDPTSHPIINAKDELAGYARQDCVPPYSDEQKTWFPITLGSDGMKGMPPTFIINTELEIMRDTGTVLEAELKDAGVAVRREVYRGLPHYFWQFPLRKAGRVFRESLVEGVDWVLAQGEGRAGRR